MKTFQALIAATGIAFTGKPAPPPTAPAVISFVMTGQTMAYCDAGHRGWVQTDRGWAKAQWLCRWADMALMSAGSPIKALPDLPEPVLP